MRRAAVALTALVLAPPAGAWSPLGSGVQNTTVPSLLVTQAGSMLASYDAPTAGTISVVRNGVGKTVVAGDPAANRTQLLQQPNGAIQLYFPNAQGVARMTSTDDGQTWTGPIQTQSHTLGPVNGAAIAPDGTPFFAQDGTGFVNVFKGADGEQVANVWTRCCGYHESLAVDSTGLAEVAFYSNADPDGATVYEALDGGLTPLAPLALKPVAEHEAPLVADHLGNTFLAWAAGYPTAASVTVVPLRGGAPAGDGVTFRGGFGGPEPHLALAVDGRDRLWLVWTQGGRLHAARSRSHGAHFGATVTVPEPGTVYELAAAAVAAGVGTVDVAVNSGSTVVTQTLQPGLSVRLFRTSKKVGGRTVVTWWGQARDDGFGVGGAKFKIGRRTFAADAAGKARLPAGHGTATAAGYVAASFRVP